MMHARCAAAVALTACLHIANCVAAHVIIAQCGLEILM